MAYKTGTSVPENFSAHLYIAAKILKDKGLHLEHGITK